MALDPITATQNAITALFEFLATPAGQRAADRFLEIDKFFHNKLADLFNKLHHQVAPDAPVPVEPPVEPPKTPGS